MASIAQINVLFKADLKEFSTEMQSASRALQKEGKKLQGLGKQLSMTITAPLTALAGFSTKISMDFDDSMRKVMATTNATSSEFKSLQEAAEKMGATTRFTASQSAEAMNYMALAGWKVADILEGIPGMLQLAAASGEDLGMVSDILTDGLTAMGKSAKDASQFVDVLAATASSSNTTVGMLGEAFQYAAPLAGALGFEVEDLGIAIGLMSNAGIKGQKAGTALRSIITRLVKPTREAQKAMSDLGIVVTNADGSVKPLAEILEVLRDKFSGLSTSQRASYAGMLAGQEAISGLLALVNAGQEDYDNLSKSINNATGTAKRMSDQMEGGAGGVWRETLSMLEAVAIKIGQDLAPLFIDLMNIVKVLAFWFVNLSDGVRKSIVIVGGLVSAIGPLLLAYGTLLKYLPLMTANFKLATASVAKFSAALMANPYGVVVAAVLAFSSALYVLSRQVDDTIKVQKTLNDVQAQASKSIASEKAELDTLLKVAKDEKLSKEQREAAIKKLNALSPDYLKSITLETINTREATVEIDKYVEALGKKASEQAILAKKTELFQAKINKEMEKVGESGWFQSAFDTMFEKIGMGSDVVIRNRKDVEDYIDTLGLSAKQAEDYRMVYDSYLKQKEKDITLIDKQIGALDDLAKAQFTPDSPVVVDPDSNSNPSGIGTDAKDNKGTISFYQAEIKVLEELRESNSTTAESYLSIGEKISELQSKIASLRGEREKAIAIEMDYTPVIEGSTVAMERQINVLKKQAEEHKSVYGAATLGYQSLENQIKDIEFEIKVNTDAAQMSIAGFTEAMKNYTSARDTAAKHGAEIIEEAEANAARMTEAVGNSVLAMGSALAQGFGEGGLSLQQFTQLFLQEIIKIIAMSQASAQTQAIEAAVTSTKSTGIGALFAMPGFIAAALGMVASAFAGVTKFADGGIVSGPTFGLMGEYAGAANNPEVIAPLNKLKDLIEPANAGSGPISISLGGGFKIDGSSLQLVLDRSSTRGKRIK